jgi:hypothetical protein
MANSLLAGTGITLTWDDVAKQLTIATNVAGSTAEAIQDIVGAMVVAGSNIDVTYDDGAGTLTIAVESLTSADLADFTAAVETAVAAMFGEAAGDVAEGDHTHVGLEPGAHTHVEDDVTDFAAEVLALTDISTISFVIDGGGSAIETGIKGDVPVDYAHEIESVTALADQSGDIVVDIWRDSYANFPPTDADSITAAAPVTISGAAKSQDTTLAGWSTTGAAGAIYRFNVDSIATIQRCTVALKVRRT